MKDNILEIKSKEFAKNVIVLCRELKVRGVEYVLYSQLLRCGTSVGANIYEAHYSQGNKDFISKLEISLKECNESEYWIELLYETQSLTESEYNKFKGYCIDIRRMLVSSVTTLKRKNET